MTGPPESTLIILTSDGVRLMESLYALYDALVSIHVPADRAGAVVDVMERDMHDKLATKADIEHLGALLSKDIAAVRVSIDHQTTAMTVKLGSLFMAGFALLFALQQFG